MESLFCGGKTEGRAPRHPTDMDLSYLAIQQKERRVLLSTTLK